MNKQNIEVSKYNALKTIFMDLKFLLILLLCEP